MSKSSNKQRLNQLKEWLGYRRELKMRLKRRLKNKRSQLYFGHFNFKLFKMKKSLFFLLLILFSIQIKAQEIIA